MNERPRDDGHAPTAPHLDYYDALLRFDRAGAIEVARAHLEATGRLERLYEDMVVPALIHAGDEWAAGPDLGLARALRHRDHPRRPPSVRPPSPGSAPSPAARWPWRPVAPGERHALGLQMVGDFVAARRPRRPRPRRRRPRGIRPRLRLGGRRPSFMRLGRPGSEPRSDRRDDRPGPLGPPQSLRPRRRPCLRRRPRPSPRPSAPTTTPRASASSRRESPRCWMPSDATGLAEFLKTGEAVPPGPSRSLRFSCKAKVQENTINEFNFILNNCGVLFPCTLPKLTVVVRRHS